MFRIVLNMTLVSLLNLQIQDSYLQAKNVAAILIFLEDNNSLIITASKDFAEFIFLITFACPQSSKKKKKKTLEKFAKHNQS